MNVKELLALIFEKENTDELLKYGDIPKEDDCTNIEYGDAFVNILKTKLINYSKGITIKGNPKDNKLL